MEDDDEFGDLYTDVLPPFPSSSSSPAIPPPQQQQLPSSAPAPLPPLHRPIDLNLKKDDDDDDEILYGASRNNLAAPSDRSLANSVQNSINLTTGNPAGGGARVLGSSDAELPVKGFSTVDSVDNQDKDMKFDIEEEGNTGLNEDSGPIIPGLAVNTGDFGKNEVDVSNGRGGGEGDEDWDEDSDSEDDLQIVLNDTNHGPIGMERGGMGDGDEDDDDEDGEPLVIVGDGDPNQTMEEQDWGMGEEGGASTAPGGEGDRKEGGEAAGKGNAAAIPKIGYSNHGYHHPFHSQFKYVRPGAGPMPGVTTVGPAGAPGQVRPPLNINPMAGRGRGDWRPPGVKGAPMQKSFHPGFGMSPWGNNVAGRGFGGGLEFTLPSHKTIFDVDIDSFEEKPWKYPGVDISDFFNFGLNEDSWKDYCKHLEQHRLETTMQSKIRVYESGRAEQDYDPDLPPELAAAAGIHDVSADNSNLGKSDAGQIDLTKGSTRVRPPLPPGRPIQVETAFAERAPSIESRPHRIRDPDVIIEIVLQDSVDDDTSGGNVADGENNGPPTDEFKVNQIAEDGMMPVRTEYFGDFPQNYNGQKSERRAQHMDSSRNDVPVRNEILPFHHEGPTPGSRRQPMMHPGPGGDLATSLEERRMHRRVPERSPQSTPDRTMQEKKFHDNSRGDSVESMDGKYSQLSSPVTLRDARESSVEEKDDAVPGDVALAEGSSGMDKDEMTESDTLKDGKMHHSSKKQKIGSHVEHPAEHTPDDGEDSKAARSSENSKARSGSSKDYQKWHDGAEEEVVQDRHSVRSGSVKRHIDENEQNFHRKDRDARQDMERKRMVAKGREGSYPHRELDPTLANHLHVKGEGLDRRKERENPDGTWQRRDEDPHGRKLRTEDTRKRERGGGDEVGSRLRSKIRESERGDKDDSLHSRKQLENGNYRLPYDKDGSARLREREDNLKPRYEAMDDYHGKRRKDEEYLRREHADKEEILHGHRETGRRRRERDDALDLRKRDEQQRIRENLDDYAPVRHKDEVWIQRERSERHRDREDLYRTKSSYEESLSKREREEGRGSVRSGRGADDKAWTGHARAKGSSDKEYLLKDAVRNSEQQKRRDRVEDESLSHHRGRDDVYARGNQSSNEDRRSKQDRSSARFESTDNQRVSDKRHKESTRKNKESEGGENSTSGSSRRNPEDQNAPEDMGLKGTGSEQANGDNDRNSSKRQKEDVSSDEEQQGSKRGRSKLERWTSHKERDYSINSKSSASLKFKTIDKNNNGGSSDASMIPKEPPRRAEAVVEKHPSTEEKDTGDMENKEGNSKLVDDRHLDTVEKLKKRSERFKLPMPSEKDAMAIKKMESEALPSIKTEATADSEIKPERPARKRRWISN